MQLAKNKGDSAFQIEYACVISSLMYLMNCTKPYITYVVNRLRRYTHNPSDMHWIALNTILRYSKCTMDYGLGYSSYPLVLKGCSDANWISNFDKLKFTINYVFMLVGGAIS